MVTVTKVKKSGAKKLKRGELLHNDQDAMEYSDEEQNEADAELATALQTIAKKAGEKTSRWSTIRRLITPRTGKISTPKSPN